MTDHVFISYSTADGLEFSRRLADELEGGEDKFIDVWFDKRNIDPARDWDDQIVDGIRSCKCMAFVMTMDSTSPGSMCKNEWTWALKYKKVIIPIRLNQDAEQPFGLGNRQWIDFTGEFEHGLAKLRKFLRDMDSPKGFLQALQDRLADAERALRRAKYDEENRIKVEIEELKKQIKAQQSIVDDPQAAKEQTQKNIKSGIEREQKPEKPIAAKSTTKFINPPPGIAPNYFQDRNFETEQIADFLKNDAQRLMTIVGRAGIGKTATICRLLKDLERGMLPDNLGEMQVDGIIYLSEAGSHKINFANIFYDLCKLLPSETSQKLDAIYKNPQASTESKMHALLDHFQGKPVLLLLDNLEPLVNDSSETLALRDAELTEALRAFLNGAYTAVKAIITTRVPPRELNRIQPGRQRIYHLEAGLGPKYAKNMLREMDADGILGLQNADDNLLSRAYERTRGFPKALEALFQILSSDRYTTLEELLAMPTPENVVEALVGEAFNRLDTNAQKVMQALAVYNRPVTPAAVDYLLAPHIPAINGAPILQRLANMHFARKESGKFYLHPVDREFAFELIPFEDLAANLTKLRQVDAEENQENSLVIPPLNLPSSQISFDLLSRRFPRFNKYIKHDLILRAADYFAQARKPRADWKKLDDLSAQLAEFDLRCAAGDYDTAASVLTEIDVNYLLLWGHYYLVINLHEKLQGKLTDNTLAQSVGNLGTAYSNIGSISDALRCYNQAIIFAKQSDRHGSEGQWLMGIGNCYAHLGDVLKAIEYYEQALAIAREVRDRKGEGKCLGNLGIMEFNSGNSQKSIEYQEQALEVARETGDILDEGIRLGNISEAFTDLGKYEEAIEHLRHAQYIAKEKGDIQGLQYTIQGESQAHFFQNDLVNARATIEAALQFDVPQNNHTASALHGIIALRQGDASAAYQSFTRAIAQADEILAKTAEYYEALDAKGLALCGLILCRGDRPVAPTIDNAIKTFHAARKIAPHAGVVKSVLRLFDELVKCDAEGILKDVGKAIEEVA